MCELEQGVAEQNLQVADFVAGPTPGLTLCIAAIPDLRSRPVSVQIELIVHATALIQRSYPDLVRGPTI